MVVLLVVWVQVSFYPHRRCFLHSPCFAAVLWLISITGGNRKVVHSEKIAQNGLGTHQRRGSDGKEWREPDIANRLGVHINSGNYLSSICRWRSNHGPAPGTGEDTSGRFPARDDDRTASVPLSQLPLVISQPFCRLRHLTHIYGSQCVMVLARPHPHCCGRDRHFELVEVRANSHNWHRSYHPTTRELVPGICLIPAPCHSRAAKTHNCVCRYRAYARRCV
jgi:hypothetical protein